MMCPDRETLLNDYVDGVLDAAGRTAAEAHLAGCAGCRAAVGELRALLAEAGGLPRRIEPPRDLWAAIAARIARPPAWRQRPFWAGALAAAASVLLALALYRATARPPERPPVAWAAVEVDYERAGDELRRTLEAERGRLRPATVALVERNLSIIERAIAESRAALARDPGSPALRQLFTAAYQEKIELLRWATRIAEAG